MGMTDTTTLGDRMKFFEARETQRQFLPMLPVYARIDGRAFSKFTRGMEKPFDPRMSAAMIAVTGYLVEETHARIGYVQSDEISLVWLAERYDSDIFFAGKVQKMCSVLASMAAARLAYFINTRSCGFSTYTTRLPAFDCRVFQFPSREEAANCFLWRERDATKNAVQSAAHAVFSPSALHGKHQGDMLAMLSDAGVNFSAYPAYFRQGTFIRRVTVTRPITDAELARIPEKHRPAPGEMVMRSETRSLDMPPFDTMTNRTAVIFDDADPVTA